MMKDFIAPHFGSRFEYDSFDELVEQWIDNNFEEYPNLSDEELNNLAEKIVNGYEWVDAIVVYIKQA